MAFALALPAIKPPYSARERWLAAYRDWRRARWMLEPGQSPDDLARNTLRMAFAPPFQRPFSALFDRQAAAAAVPWYLAGGATGCVAAYQPKGAASLAASYTNLANPGTYDAAPGVAPTFDAATGWTFNGSSQYLTTSIVPSGDQTWSLLVRLSGGSTNNRNMIGLVQTSPTRWFGIHNYYGGDFVRYATGATALQVAPRLEAGVLGVAGRQGYRNGVADGSLITAGTVTITTDIYIGARHVNASVDEYWPGNIQAVAIYNTTLTAPQVAAVSAAMAAL